MKTLHHGKVVEQLDPTDVSTSAVARRVAYLKRNADDMDADLFEALVADRDRLALENETFVASMTEMAERSTAALGEARSRIERAERADFALERIVLALKRTVSELRHNEGKLLAEIEELKQRQLPWGV